MGLSFDAVSISGGGSASAFWCSIMADVLGASVHRLAANDGPAYGAAILAAVGAGHFPSVEAACSELIRIRSTEAPDPGRQDRYDEKYAKFSGIYPALQGLFKTLNS